MVYLWVFFVICIIAIGFTLVYMAKSTDIFHKEFRDKQHGFPDLLRYESIIANGIILGKGGELISTYRYRGPDVDCSSDNELNYLRTRVAAMVASLKGGWMIHPTTLRYRSVDYPDDGAFPDSVTRAIENERGGQYRAEGTHHENEYFITFTFLPDPLLLNKIKEFAYDVDKSSKLSTGMVLERTIQHFQRAMTEYVSALESGLTEKLTQLKAVQKLDPKTHRMAWYDEQLSFIHECITGVKQQIRLPSMVVPTGVDYILGSYPFYPGVKPRINDMHIRVIAIESPPDAGTYFGILDVLNKLPIQYRWTTRWIARDQEVVKANIEKIRSKWRQKIRGFVAEYRGKTNGPINTDALNMAQDAEAAINDINAGTVSYGQWTSTVVLFGTNETYIDQLATYTLKEIRDMGFTCRSEEVNCNEAYLGSLPGHGYENVRRPEIHSLNLADTLPLTSTWQGPVENKCEFYKKFYPDNALVPPLFYGAASGGTPFRVVLHNGDLGHTMIVGPTGAGKSTLLALIAASQFRYPNAKVFAFDKGESLLALCLGAGGTHYSFMDDTAINKDIGFAPLAQIHKLSERIWATDYIVTIAELHNVTIDLDRRSEIKKAVDLLATRPVDMRTFTDLASLVQTREIRQVLHFYEEEGAMGMLNKKSDNLKTSNFMVFEIEHLMEMSEPHIVPVLLYLFRVIERNLDGSPVLIPFDEGWLTLRHELFKEKLREWLKVLRKANAAVIFSTQEFQDIDSSTIASTLYSACQTKILLPNAEATSDENAPLYQKIGLSPRETHLISRAVPKRDYFFKSPGGRRLFQLELGPVALAFVGVSGVDDRKIIKELYRMHGKNWTHHWLKLRNISPDILNEKEPEIYQLRA